MCGVDKPLTEGYFNRSLGQFTTNRCKLCHRAYMAGRNSAMEGCMEIISRHTEAMLQELEKYTKFARGYGKKTQ
jgi:hypothetical protein